MSGVARQRDLFTRRPSRRAPPLYEIAVHRMVAELLDRTLMPGWLWFHPANGEVRDKAAAGRLKSMGVKVGVSDIILISPPAGRVHALELKRQGETPRMTQKLFLEAVRGAGGQAAWADSFDGALAVLKGWGAVRLKP